MILKKEYLIIGEGHKSQFGKEKQENAHAFHTLFLWNSCRMDIFPHY